MSTILIFDLSPKLTEAFSELLSGYGHDVIVANAFDEVAKVRAGKNVDLHILEVTGLNREFLRKKINAQGISGPVIITTNDNSWKEMGDIVSVGLMKPFTAREFLNTLGFYLPQHRKQRPRRLTLETAENL